MFRSHARLLIGCWNCISQHIPVLRPTSRQVSEPTGQESSRAGPNVEQAGRRLPCPLHPQAQVGKGSCPVPPRARLATRAALRPQSQCTGRGSSLLQFKGPPSSQLPTQVWHRDAQSSLSKLPPGLACERPRSVTASVSLRPAIDAAQVSHINPQRLSLRAAKSTLLITRRKTATGLMHFHFLSK